MMKTFQALVVFVATLLYILPADALLPLYKNYRMNDLKGLVVNDPGMLQSPVPQLRSTIEPLLKRAGSCNPGFFLCGDNCISTSYTCCIDTRTNTPSGWCTMPNPQCCLNTGKYDAFCCNQGYDCAFDPDGCTLTSVDVVTTVTVTPPTPGPVTVTADAPAADTTTVAGPSADTITVTPPQVVLTVTQSPQTVTVTQSVGGTTVTVTFGTSTAVTTT